MAMLESEESSVSYQPPFSPNVSECVRDMSQTYEISLCCDLFTFDLNQLPVTYLDFEVFHVCLILSHPT